MFTTQCNGSTLVFSILVHLLMWKQKECVGCSPHRSLTLSTVLSRAYRSNPAWKLRQAARKRRGSILFSLCVRATSGRACDTDYPLSLREFVGIAKSGKCVAGQKTKTIRLNSVYLHLVEIVFLIFGLILSLVEFLFQLSFMLIIVDQRS